MFITPGFISGYIGIMEKKMETTVGIIGLYKYIHIYIYNQSPAMHF